MRTATQAIIRTSASGKKAGDKDLGNSLAEGNGRPLSDGYRRLLRQRNRSAWILAVVTAMGLNLGLFLLMPHLLHSAPAKPTFDTLLPQIQMMRLKRPESPVERKPPRPPEPEKQHQPPQPKLNSTALHRPVWPFEINTRLPGGPDTLVLPPVESDLKHMGLNDLFNVGDLDQPLITLTRMPPIYPLGAKRRGIEGTVTVRFIVNEQGTVEQPTIVTSQPPEIFDDTVLRCVSGWHFQSGTVEGHPVRVWAETTIHFELD